MSKAKNINDIKNANIKKNLTATKKSSNITITKKRGRPPKKRLVVDEEVNNNIIGEEDAKLIKKGNSNKRVDNDVISNIPVKKSNLNKTNKIELTKEEVAAQRKERNRKKYQNSQKKYKDVTKTKKQIITKEETENQIIDIKNDKENDFNLEPKKKNNAEKNDIKEKRKENRKQNQFTKTIVNIKLKSEETINVVKQKTTDKNIPLGNSKEEKHIRRKRYIKEAIVYSILLSIVDIICITFIDYFNFLRLFDVKYLNVIVTIIILLIFNFFIAFMVEFFVTNIWLKKIRKKKDGEQNGDSGVK